MNEDTGYCSVKKEFSGFLVVFTKTFSYNPNGATFLGFSFKSKLLTYFFTSPSVHPLANI